MGLLAMLGLRRPPPPTRSRIEQYVMAARHAAERYETEAEPHNLNAPPPCFVTPGSCANHHRADLPKCSGPNGATVPYCPDCGVLFDSPEFEAWFGAMAGPPKTEVPPKRRAEPVVVPEDVTRRARKVWELYSRGTDGERAAAIGRLGSMAARLGVPLGDFLHACGLEV
jgi:hypothetical protein